MTVSKAFQYVTNRLIMANFGHLPLLHKEKMFRLILKTSLILVCVNINAAPEIIDNTAVGIELESVATELIEEAVLPDGAEDVAAEERNEAVEVEDVAIEERYEVVEVDDVVEAAFEPDEAVVFEEITLDAPFQVGEGNGLSKDVVLVLDNSGSMKKNDPNFLVSEAVKEFISQQDANTRVAVVIFDQDVRMPVPLTDASLSNRETILNSIEAINYKGLFTDSPAGIERAIYELKNNGRDDVQKSIIFMTDGIVDTGVPERDLEKSKWLREDLAPDAADNEIKIFGIAFTDGADFQLIQSISQKTNGEYYRALTVEDLPYVFEQINEIINKPEVVDVIPEKPEPVPVVVQPVAPPAPVIIEVPVPTMGEEERIRSMIIIAAAIVLTLTLLGILILLLRRNRELKAGTSEFVQEAYINDLQSNTDKQTHKLGTRPTMFGRVAGKDTDHLDYIVVNESTIGRRHAMIEFKDYSFWIVDQGSINGTFVNGEPVNSEIRLKHGDRIRLHKCEFEFIMPEMEDSGMTVISKTVFAAQAPADDSEDETQLRDHDDSEDETQLRDQGDSEDATEAPVKGDSGDQAAPFADMDFDITGTASSLDELSDLPGAAAPDFNLEKSAAAHAKTVKLSANAINMDSSEDDASADDETIMIDDDEDDSSLGSDATLRKDDS